MNSGTADGKITLFASFMKASEEEKGVYMINRKYGKEPFDLHLFVLLLLRKIWVVALAGIIGGIVIGGIYYLKNITFSPAQKYEMVSDSYIEYAVNEEGNEYTYFNQTTWESLIYADDIINSVASKVEIPKEEIIQAISATLLSDTRILTTTVQGYDKEEVKEMNQALLLAIEEFAGTKREFAFIQPLRVPEDATLQNLDIRVWNATVLGISVGLLLSFFALSLFFIWDDRIYLPSIFESRYQIPVLRKEEIKESKGKYTYLLLDKNRKSLQNLPTEIKESEALIDNPFWDENAIKKLNKNETYVLVICSKTHNSKLIEGTLSLLDKKECTVVAAVLYETYDTLQKIYYFPGSKWIKKHLK